MDNKGSSAPGQREGTTTAAASTAAVPAYVMDAIYGAETGGKTKAEKYDESINKYVENNTSHILHIETVAREVAQWSSVGVEKHA